MAEERTSEWISEVARLVPSVMRRLFPPPAEGTPLWDLTLPQRRVLFILGSRGDLTMREAASSLAVAMSTATQVADRLERLGLVERKADRSDRRVVRLTLTRVGEETIAAQLQERDERIAAAMARLSPAEQGQIQAGLRLLEEAARESHPHPAPSGRQPVWEIAAAICRTVGQNTEEAIKYGPGTIQSEE